MIKKIIKVGNSAAVIIPKDFLKKLNASVGNIVVLKLHPNKRKITIRLNERKNKNKEGIIDKEVYSVAKDLLHRYLPAFKELL